MLKRITEQIKSVHQDEQGQGMAEYGLIIALIAVICIAGFSLLGGGVKNKIKEASDALK